MLHTIIIRPVTFILRSTIVTLLFISSVIAAEPVTADPVKFEIDNQPLGSALNEFARQSDREILFSTDVVRDKDAQLVVGAYEPEDALELLLADTGLEYSVTVNDTFLVSEEGESESGKFQPASSQVLMAQNQTSAPQKQTSQTTNSNDDEDNRAIPLEEIIVTGTHIRGVESIGALSMTFSREELDRTGYSTVEELMQSLPQNLDEISADAVSADGVSRIAGSNTQGASSISLRGLGPGSTLVLLNGKRRPGNINGRVFDVSAIPLSMVKRVEVVTGGRSAIYGSDAVAGVVNIVTLADYDGAETQVYYGESSAGGERFNFSQTFGRNFDKGGFSLGYNYRDDEVLDLTATGVVQAPSFDGRTPLPGLYYIRYPSEQHVGLFAGYFELSDKIQLYSDAHFSSDENKAGQATRTVIPGCCEFDLGQVVVTDSDQYSVVGGVRLDVGKDWQIDVSGLYGVVDNTYPVANLFAFGPDVISSFDVPPDSQQDDEAKLTVFSAIADGPLGAIGGGAVSVAIGIEFRDESYERIQTTFPAGTVTPGEDRDRDIFSFFGEVHLPLINRDGQRFEVSLAGRYDDYSDFGDTFNPQLGVEWEPISGLTFRGSYAEAFRAPDLFVLDLSNQILISPIPDPTAPGGMSTTLGEFGGNPLLQPEEADTWTVGIDWEPSDRSRLSLSYFNIEYVNRIDEPADVLFTVLLDESLFPGLVNRSPTAEELDEILARTDLSIFLNFTGIPFDPTTDDPLAVFPGLVYFDNRRNNIAIEEVDGIDLQASTVLETGSGDWSFDLNGTYYLDFERTTTATSPVIDQLNRPGRPVDLKLRGRIGWSRSAWNVNAYVNYVDSYEDTFPTTPIEIDSWTTVDLTLRYDASEITNSGFFNGFKVTLGINNVFDEDPPVYLSNIFGLGYDPVNADPIGRFVSLRLSKSW